MSDTITYQGTTSVKWWLVAIQIYNRNIVDTKYIAIYNYIYIWKKGTIHITVWPKKRYTHFKNVITFQRIKIFWICLFYSTYNSIIYQYLQALMKIHSHCITFNSQERGTKIKAAQELIKNYVQTPLFSSQGFIYFNY